MEWKLYNPIVYPTVDCAIFTDNTYSMMYVAKKLGQTKYRFVGGFVDPQDESYQSAALREAKEETNLECKIDSFITSCKVDDDRYREKDDKIITTLFTMFPVNDMNAQPMDDIAELQLLKFDSLCEDDFVTEHIPLFISLKNWLDKKEILEQIDSRKLQIKELEKKKEKIDNDLVECNLDLEECIQKYKNNSEDYPSLITWISIQTYNKAVSPPEFFEMDEETTYEFNCWGHNSRWTNVFWNYLDNNAEKCIEKCKILSTLPNQI